MESLPDGVHDTVNRTSVPLIPSKSPVCWSTGHFLSPSHAALRNILDAVRKNGSLAASYTAGEARYTLSLSPVGEIMG